MLSNQWVTKFNSAGDSFGEFNFSDLFSARIIHYFLIGFAVRR
jgi:hypothetical protein